MWIVEVVDARGRHGEIFQSVHAKNPNNRIVSLRQCLNVNEARVFAKTELYGGRPPCRGCREADQIKAHTRYLVQRARFRSFRSKTWNKLTHD